jgi:hypothetical protein
MNNISKLNIGKLRELRRKSYNVAIENLKAAAPKGSQWLWYKQSKNDSDGLNEVRLLVSQFYYGIDAQNELLELCIKLGWMKIN